MGNLIKPNSINPQAEKSRRRKSLLAIPQTSRQVSRANLQYISQHSITGIQQQSITWIAQNIEDHSQLFFVKQSQKYTLYNNKRIPSIKIQMRMLSHQDLPFVNPCIYAFQDYRYLYMVSEYVQGYTLEEVLREHSFTQEETKYVVMALINIIDAMHIRGFVMGELAPRNIIVDKKTCSIKLIELINPLRIDSYYPSDTIAATSIYAAPQVLVMDKIRGEADFYSLGLIMYEMITQKSPLKSLVFNSKNNENLDNNNGAMNEIDRTSILNEDIIVTKSDLPEGWNPQATDMLIKLIIKNPHLRLGRYGSFEVRSHPWLQNSNNWELFNDFGGRNIKTGKGSRNQRKQSLFVPNSGINLVEEYFTERREIQKNVVDFQIKHVVKNERKEKMISTFAFQQLFQDYEFRRDNLLKFDDQTESIIED